jgi:hypothetical protein
VFQGHFSSNCTDNGKQPAGNKVADISEWVDSASTELPDGSEDGRLASLFLGILEFLTNLSFIFLLAAAAAPASRKRSLDENSDEEDDITDAMCDAALSSASAGQPAKKARATGKAATCTPAFARALQQMEQRNGRADFRYTTPLLFELFLTKSLFVVSR